MTPTEMKRLLDDVSETLQRYALGIYALDLDEGCEPSSQREQAGGARPEPGAATALTGLPQATPPLPPAEPGRIRDALDRGRACRGSKAPLASSSGDTAPPSPDLRPLHAAYSAVLDDLTVLAGYLGRQDLGTLPYARLGEFLTGLAVDDITPYRLPALCAIERDLSELGAGRLVDEFANSCVMQTLG